MEIHFIEYKTESQRTIETINAKQSFIHIPQIGDEFTIRGCSYRVTSKHFHNPSKTLFIHLLEK